MTTCTLNLQQRPHLGAAARNYHYGIERFLLASHWSLHVYRYHARLIVDDTPFDICPGSLTLVPPNTPIEYQHQGLSTHVYAHFMLPAWPVDAPTFSLPIFTDLRSEFARFETEMETIAQALLHNRDRAEIKLWNLLFELAARGHVSTPERHPSLDKAMSIIELRLGEDIAITSLAREVGLSHNHLTRLFRQATGSTVVAYVRRQRAERAKHLLQHTTMPLKVIATQVNASDLQSFSALMKKETGRAPSYWRRGEVRAEEGL
ncbi:AraC family transcriptional regulator [bacterium]|nr:MAG: AraC family transcriptional regulator [bacterium]